jgi:predicted unusual protein kinase regulating ubiquinone biosynthesis (AarF/ABC1/UbiB family)
VAQALKCTITYADGTTKDAVVKILRPDAAMRAQREKAVFLNAAREVGNGMEQTFEGQFAGIMEELDLRKEAENVKIGNRVYHHENRTDYTKAAVTDSYGSFANVHSMKLVDGVEPSINVMVLEQVQGNTLENYLKEVGELSRETNDLGTLDKLYDDVKGKYEALVNLAYMWTNEGLFAEGFYHGDIHKGNIMTSYSWDMSAEEKANDPGRGITLIDFGNASKLNKEERANVIQVVAGTATNDAGLFSKGFRALLSADSRAKFDAAGQDLKEQLAAIFEKGTLQDTAARMSAALKLMQREYQIEVPGPIHNFLESQRRLQVAMDETLSTLDAIEVKRENMGGKANDYKPGSMMKCITDVVKQNLYAAMNSIGAGKAKDCYQKIKGELEAPADIPAHAIRV